MARSLTGPTSCASFRKRSKNKVWRRSEILLSRKNIPSVLCTKNPPDTVVVQLSLKAVELSFRFVESQNLLLILVPSQRTTASQVGDSRLEMVLEMILDD